MMKNLKPGSILEIPLEAGKVGYAAVGRIDDIGPLMKLYNYVGAGLGSAELERIPVKAWFYVNMASIRRRWRMAGALASLDNNPPIHFTGTPRSFWVLHTGEGDVRVDAAETSFDDMIKAGHVPSTIWLAQAVEQCLRGERELKWKW